MALYSHSKLATFETCRLQYKCRYIDRIKVETDTIEKHLGKVVHDVLEKLYKDMLMGKTNSKEAMLGHYEKLWDRGWHDKIMIVKQEYSAHDYWKRGERSVSDYYDQYYPFDQGKTIGLERKVMFDLDAEGKHKIQGYIDRLVYCGDGHYEIHDYKTASHPPSDESLKEDRQLALYQIDVEEKFEDCKSVKLIWHYLTFGKEFSSKRTKEELAELKARTIKLIEELEATDDFPPRENPVCPWCDYQYLCPVRKHLVKVDAMTVEEYKKEPGVNLVNRWVELAARKKQIEKELDILKEPIIDYARREGCDVIRGNTHKLRITQDRGWQFPGTSIKERHAREELINLLRDMDRLDEVSNIDMHALKRVMAGESWPADILEKLRGFAKETLNHRITQSKLKDDDIADD